MVYRVYLEKLFIMKKIFVYVMFTLLSVAPAIAETMAVQSLSEISTEKPEAIIKLKVARNCKLDNVELKEGYILEGKILNVIDPKRLKQDAKFTFYPTYYTNLKGKKSRFAKVYVGEYTPNFEIDAAKLAKTAALTVGNHFVKGISTGFYAVEGAVENEDGNRVKSAAHNVYENSIFSYAEKGEQLDIKPDTYFGLRFDDCVNSKEE